MGNSINKITAILLSLAMLLMGFLGAMPVLAEVGDNVVQFHLADNGVTQINGNAVSMESDKELSYQGDTASFIFTLADGKEITRIGIDGGDIALDGTDTTKVACTAKYDKTSKTLTISNVTNSHFMIDLSTTTDSGGGGNPGGGGSETPDITFNVAGTGLNSINGIADNKTFLVTDNAGNYVFELADGKSIASFRIGGDLLTLDGNAHNLNSCTATYNSETKTLSLTNITQPHLNVDVAMAGDFNISIGGKGSGTISYSLDGGPWTDVVKVAGETPTNATVNISGKTTIKLKGTSARFYDFTVMDQSGQPVEYSGSYDDFKGDTGITLNLDSSKSYMFHADYSDKEIRTIVWTYDKTKFSEDAYVEHGKVEVVSVGNDTLNYTGMDENDSYGGHVNVEVGQTVVVKLIPDYGYQVGGVSLNGGKELEAVDGNNNISTFTFVMGESNIHFKGKFVSSQDTIDCTQSKVVTSATIEDGENAAINGGNLKMVVSDNAAYNTNVTGAVTGTNVETVGAVDIALTNFVSKGTTGSSWETPVTEFNKNIVVSTKIDGDALASNETYSVVRDHNGTLTELNATYNANTEELSFPTNQFSTYTIVKKQVKAPAASAPTTNDSGMSFLYVTTFALAVILFAIFTYMQRRKNQVR